MNIHEAIGDVIGKKLADCIIADMGIHWAVVAAMAEARLPQHTEAVAAINAWNAAQKALDEEMQP